jgi:hypothetical protein
MTLPQIFLPVVWSGFILFTVKKFWSRSVDLSLRKYDLGAKAYCFVATAFCALILPSIFIFPDVPYWLEGVIYGLIAFPVSLWAGRFVVYCFQRMDRSR